MRVQNIKTKQVFHGTMYENLGDGYISIYNHHEEIARVPTELARLIFSENEIPYMEEVE
jgi:hypothetical protein